MPLEMMGRDIYLRHTDATGNSHVVQHRVWDAELFISSQRAAAEKVNREQKGDAPRLAAVQQLTEEQYRKERAN